MLTPRERTRLTMGFCMDCGEPREGEGSTTTRCPACAESVRQSARARLKRLLAAGLCVRCQAPLGEGSAKTVCASCREKIRNESKAYSAKRKEAGLCSWCGAPSRYVMCLKHRLVRAEQREQEKDRGGPESSHARARPGGYTTQG